MMFLPVWTLYVIVGRSPSSSSIILGFDWGILFVIGVGRGIFRFGLIKAGAGTSLCVCCSFDVFLNLLLSWNKFETTGELPPFGHPQCWSMLLEVLDF